MPASTIRNSPVMFDALVRKNSTASAICAVVPAWRSGVVGVRYADKIKAYPTMTSPQEARDAKDEEAKGD
jgi:hypothetical protein